MYKDSQPVTSPLICKLLPIIAGSLAAGNVVAACEGLPILASSTSVMGSDNSAPILRKATVAVFLRFRQCSLLRNLFFAAVQSSFEPTTSDLSALPVAKSSTQDPLSRNQKPSAISTQYKSEAALIRE
jgi:hypothetical protein